MNQTARYVLILVAFLALWDTIAVKPLKIFTIYLHELGHTLMAFVFGYGISGFQVNLNESGHTIVHSKGLFSSIMITSGGYLGSVLFALLILYLRKTALKKYILGTVAIIFLGVSIKYSGFSFTLLYPIIFTAGVLILYMVQKEKLNDWVIEIIGISSVAYAIYDTFVDTILLQLNSYFHLISGWNDTPMTDAVRLAEITPIPAIVWGILWFLISILAVNAVLLKKGKSRAS